MGEFGNAARSQTLQSHSPAEVSQVSQDRTERRQRYLEVCGRFYDRFMPEEGELFGYSFSDIEEELEKKSRAFAAELCKHRLAMDPLANWDQNFPCPKCGRRMRVQRQVQTRLLPSTMGPVQMARPYCVCDPCGFCCAPLDYALGIPSRGPSVARRELVCHAATKDRSFEKASVTLDHHSKLTMTDEGVRRLAESEGRRLVEERARRVEACFRNRGRVPGAPQWPVSCLVVVCDGGRVQTCSPNPKERWKEDRIGCVYDAEPKPDPAAATAQDYKGATALTKTYVGTMECWKDFGPMLFTEACTRGYMEALLKIFISDGALALLDVRDEHFSDAHPIIDWYHAAGHLADCAKAAFGADTEESDRGFELQKERLWHGELELVIHAISKESHRVGPPPPKALDSDPRVVLHRNVGYFTRNQQAMDYPTYRTHGWPIASGVAEGCVKQFGLRVKGSEKFWEIPGAEETLALCELYFSEDGRWDRYWRVRATPPPDAIVFRPKSASSPHRDAD